AVAPHDEYSDKLVAAGCVYHPVKMDSRGVNPVKDFALTLELYNIYKKIRPETILHYTIKPNIYGTFAASLLKIPVVNNVCGLGTAFLQKNLVSYIAIGLYKLAFRTPRKIFFQNIDDKEFFEEKGIVKKNQSEVIPGSGIDISKFVPGKKKKNKGNKFTFLLISRLIYDKGIVEYVEAVKHLRENGVDADFQLLGSKDPVHRRGIPEELIDKWVETNSIDYLGSTDDVRPFIENANCVVLPSYREGTPRTLLEAASLEKPIVASKVAGCTNIVKDQHNGLLCEVMNATDLASKMNQMINIPEEKRSEMGKNGRILVESRFKQEFVIDKYLDTIDKIGQ
ncbi:MAG: glycosyltransferase family 4 protein, partial [Saprospiraceae bacterium]|nr:glycosyltransferase family 4 protein [Saprospiraceae bacterium]